MLKNLFYKINKSNLYPQTILLNTKNVLSMKKFFTNTVMVLFISLLVSTAAKAQPSPNRICFNDGFYLWRLDLTDNGHGNFWATGTVEISEGFYWNVYGYGSFPDGATSSGTVELHALNPTPDGCTFYTDSFTYWGNGIGYNTGTGVNSWTASGTWDNYCYGAYLGSGTWSGSANKRVCFNAFNSKPGLIGPAISNKSALLINAAKALNLTVSPNPVKDYTAVQYNIAKQSQVSITIYNMMQQPVKVLVNGVQQAGHYSTIWNGRNASGVQMPTGLYHVVAIVDGKTFTTTLQVVN